MPELLDQAVEGATRKLGPLPAWAWGLVAAGGIWAWRAVTRSSSSRAVQGADLSGDPSSVIPSLSGGGAPPPTPGFGAPEGEQSSLFISTPDLTAEGEAEDVQSLVDSIIAATRSNTSTGGNAGTAPTAQPKPASKPPSGNTSTTTKTTTPAPKPKPKPDPCSDQSSWPTYTVVRGDTMKRIGAKLYGSEAKWASHIRPYNSPRSGSWDLIYPGERFRYKPANCP